MGYLVSLLECPRDALNYVEGEMLTLLCAHRGDYTVRMWCFVDERSPRYAVEGPATDEEWNWSDPNTEDPRLGGTDFQSEQVGAAMEDFRRRCREMEDRR